MNETAHFGWDRLRHGGLLLDAPRLQQIAEFTPEPVPDFLEQKLRRQADAVLDGRAEASAFVSFVLEHVCGFLPATGTWQRGSQVGSQWTRRAVTGEAVKPRHLWQGESGGILPVFFDTEKRIGIGRGRKAASQTIQWLRAGKERMALLTNCRQWRLIFAGLDFDAWCEWDVDLWFEEGRLSPQVTALQTLLSPAVWSPQATEETPPLLQAVQDSRKGQAELSAVLGERVREAVEILLQSHGQVLKEQCTEADPSDIYRAAVRVVMRIVVAHFAESRELLPQDNACYHGAYGINGLRDSLEKQAARGTGRMARSWSAWPRIIGLFRLIYLGSHHQALPVPEYGGELFAPGDPDGSDGMSKALSVFETACFSRELMTDRDVFHLLERITRTRIKIRQGRASTWVPAPVDFSDLSSEYIGILYEGLLDFELKTAPEEDPVIFLSVGNQPALPLSRLEAMDDKALANLLEKMKDTGGQEEAEAEEAATEETPDVDHGGDGAHGDDGAADDDDADHDADDEDHGDDESGDEDTDSDEDQRQSVRARAETWARHAVLAGKLVPKPKGKLTPEKKLVYEEKVSRKARQLVSRVVLPGEWYLVRWGGTRKGSGTFYTRPGLAVPTVQRTLKPLAYRLQQESDGHRDQDTPEGAWTPKKPEEILALKVCDPACGSGTFLVAALRYLTDALYASLHQHKRVRDDGDRSVISLITGREGTEERLCEEILPCRPDDSQFESRLKAVLRRHVVERCLYGVDLDPLAVELCRLSLWIETMDRNLPFSFLDHKVKCGNSLVGAWFDQFQHYPAMAWKNRDGGDKNHTNGVHFEKEARTKALKEFVKDTLTPDLLDLIENRVLFQAEAMAKAQKVHDEALKTFSRLHDLPVYENEERARIYRDEVLGSESYQALKSAMDLWCACWFWPPGQLEHAPLPTSFTHPDEETLQIAGLLASRKRFFHWELEFPDVFNKPGSGFDGVLGNPPWENLQPNPEEFFSNIDPLFRTYGRISKQKRQRELFEADSKLEQKWLDYCADFNSFSHWVSQLSNPFGDPDSSASKNSFSLGRGGKLLHKKWQDCRKQSKSYRTGSTPFRYQLGRIFTYKLFLEQSWILLRDGGRFGQITPSGIYSDAWSQPLRELFLSNCKWEWLFGFENRDKVFQIDSRFKFNPLIIEKGGETDIILTAFMRRKIEDWEFAEAFSIPYSRRQVERFSPQYNSVLEIQSSVDLEILEKIHKNYVLLGDDSHNGWQFKYKLEFMMNTDAILFPPRPQWEEKGYRADEYSRWIKGEWSPIQDLWKEIDVDVYNYKNSPSQPHNTNREDNSTFGGYPAHYAQPPYDRLPIPRANLPTGIIFSRDGALWISEDNVEDIALPLYEGRMIGQFDFSQKGWVSGKGRGAVWRDVEWGKKNIEPQFLMKSSDFSCRISENSFLKIVLMDVTSSTNTRTMVATAIHTVPCGHKTPTLTPHPWSYERVLASVGIFNSFLFDFEIRERLGGNSLIWSVLAETAIPRGMIEYYDKIASLVLPLSLGNVAFSNVWLKSKQIATHLSWRALWNITDSSRVEKRVQLDTILFALSGLDIKDVSYILQGCDYPAKEKGVRLSKGFWRVDKNKDPELRQTVLTLIAFHNLEEKILECGGDRDKGIEAFQNQNDGEGWMLPETLRLADYGLGHDDRAREYQLVASRFGPRFYDWQLAQRAEESWRECHLHARNMLGKAGYINLLGEVLGDTEPANWKDTLKPAYDLTEKESLVRIFSIAFGFFSPEAWQDCSEQVSPIFREKGFPFQPEDSIRIISVALEKAPRESRAQCLAAARSILDPAGFLAALEQLLESVSRRKDDPWHVLVRKQIGDAEYRKLTAGFETTAQAKVAEEQVPYGKDKKGHQQKDLFD